MSHSLHKTGISLAENCPKKVPKQNTSALFVFTQHNIQNCRFILNTLFTSFARSHKSHWYFYLVFKTIILNRLQMIGFWQKHLVWNNKKGLCLTEIEFVCLDSVLLSVFQFLNRSKCFSLFHRAFQFTIYNGQTNALLCNKTLIQMSHIKTLKITPTCFNHQLIIIRKLFDPG
jgi:hypothetical protein